MEQPPYEEQPEQEQSGDVARIEIGIDIARAEERPIDDGTVRRIASQLHEGQASALYSLASAGALNREGLDAELAGMEVSEDTPREVLTWCAELRKYIAAREDDAPVSGWYLTTADSHGLDDTDSCSSCGAHFSEPHAPDCMVLIGQPDDEHQDGDLEDDDSDAELTPEPRVWIGALSARNEGNLHGTWVRANRGIEYLKRHVDAILHTSPVEDEEEWYIADTDNFKGIDIHEYTSLEAVAELGRLVETHGEPFVHYARHIGYESVEGLEERFRNAYRGEFTSLAAYVEDQLTEQEALDFIDQAPEWLQPHVSIDFEMIGNGWESEGLIAIESWNHSVTYIYVDPQA